MQGPTIACNCVRRLNGLLQPLCTCALEARRLLHRTLDSALVSPGVATPFPNVKHAPDMSQGMTFCLGNNIWGTNYVMWQPYLQEAANQRFRFELRMSDLGAATARQQAWAAE